MEIKKANLYGGFHRSNLFSDSFRTSCHTEIGAFTKLAIATGRVGKLTYMPKQSLTIHQERGLYKFATSPRPALYLIKRLLEDVEKGTVNTIVQQMHGETANS